MTPLQHWLEGLGVVLLFYFCRFLKWTPRDFPRHLRTNETPEERAVWNAISKLRPRFTRQLRAHPHIGDFACRKARLIVEINGIQHAENSKDDRRTVELEAAGWRVIQFWNSVVQSNLEGVVRAIMEAGNERLPPGQGFEFRWLSRRT